MTQLNRLPYPFTFKPIVMRGIDPERHQPLFVRIAPDRCSMSCFLPPPQRRVIVAIACPPQSDALVLKRTDACTKLTLFGRFHHAAGEYQRLHLHLSDSDPDLLCAVMYRAADHRHLDCRRSTLRLDTGSLHHLRQFLRWAAHIAGGANTAALERAFQNLPVRGG